ncbi:MAG: guanylate kinase [Candidatus Omnitrophota bacterium]|nr:guanylate kinase [Candidatus Omnitrophota bacterium]
MAKQGLLIVVSAPSGSGKTTLCKKLVSACSDARHSISATTRPVRKGERNGRDYFFLTAEEFKKRKQNKEFLEWARVFGEYYGTPRKFIKESTRKGKDVVLNIDVQGALQIKRLDPEAVFIFVLPPSLKILEQRLRKRKKDSAQEISKRLRLAKTEISRIDNYDYVIVNKSINDSFRRLLAIVTAEKCKIKRKGRR